LICDTEEQVAAILATSLLPLAQELWLMLDIPYTSQWAMTCPKGIQPQNTYRVSQKNWATG